MDKRQHSLATIRRWGCVSAAALLMLLSLCGCATTESDMPWNAPQSWEGTLSLPGMQR